MGDLLEWMLNPILDKGSLLIKRFRARRWLRRLSMRSDWAREIRSNPNHVRALLKDENLLHLFLDRDYRRELDNNPETRLSFMKRLASKTSEE